MNDGPKKTKQAVNAAVWKGNSILILGRTKWLSEGTPWIMPGGGVEEDEELVDALARELEEEIGGWPELYRIGDAMRGILKPTWEYKTKWTDSLSIFELFVSPSYQPVIETKLITFADQQKFFGFVWLDVLDNVMLRLFWPFLMPGLKQYLKNERIKPEQVKKIEAV